MKCIVKLPFLFLFLAFLGCKETINTKENKTLNSQETYLEPEFVIDGIYSTSTAIPLSKNHVVNVLDRDTKTSWKTLQGAGPNEGVMIYFSKPIFIKKINIIQASGVAITTVNQFDVYANGKLYKPESINTLVEAIFVRVTEVNPNDIKVSAIKTDGVYGEMKGSNTTFSSKKSVAISEIEFFDKSDTKIDFVIPKLLKAFIKSTSTLTPEVAYSASNLFDCKKDFGWAENVSGNGVGEIITVKTATPIECNKVKVWNGYQRSSQHFEANGSVKELNILNQDFSLRNVQTPQQFYIKKRALSNTLKFTLKDVYEGERYEDVLMSEIRLYEKNIPIILLSEESEKVIEKNRKESESNAIIEAILDKNMKMVLKEREEIEGTFFNKNKETSFTLRSNNSFVMYRTENQRYDGQEEEFSSQTIADGNWELISKNDDEVKIRVFGRIYDVFDGVDTYKGKGQKESTKIFKDIVTLTLDFIKGEKFIDTIQLR